MRWHQSSWLLLLGLVVGGHGPAVAAEPPRVAGTACGLVADGGTVTLTGAGGAPLVQFDGLALTWAPPRTAGGRASQPTADALRVDYTLADDASGKMRAYAVFSRRGATIQAEYHLTVPPGTPVAGTMLRRRAAGSSLGALFKAGRWTRHPHGGVPFEAQDGVFRPFSGAAGTAWEVVGGNPNWASDTAQHLRLSQVQHTDEWVGREEFLVTPAATNALAAAARYHGRPLALDVTTSQPFNLYDAGTGHPELTVSLTNADAAPAPQVEMVVWARDFDGHQVLAQRETATLVGGQTRTWRVTLPVGDRQGIWFVEASAHLGTQECFARTNVAVLEPFAYPHREQSVVGLSAWFPIPSQAEVLDLCRRIGVRWFRSGDTRVLGPAAAAVANWHSAYDPDAWKGKPEAAKEAMLRTTLAECDARGNPSWELGNEWDLTKDPALARAYVEDWLKPLARLRAETHSRVELLTMGFANGFHGTETLRALHAAGGWPLVSGVAYHLGRGNVTADDADPALTWSYLGSLRAVKATIAALGEKPLFLTEVYACTKPNSWWHDSLRAAAENTILTFALAQAEGVKVVNFYQLHDSVWHDVGGVNPDDPEYSFGLLDRRGTIKPSLLAFATIARALDGATGVHYLKFADPLLRGIGFQSPAGPAAVLWDRTDGDVQSTQSDTYAAPEPWVPHWRSHKSVLLPATGEQVTVVDCIGRRSVVAPRQEQVELTLTGAPVVVYGLAP